MVAKLRSGTPEEISQLIRGIQNLPTDQDAVNYLLADQAMSNIEGKELSMNYNS